jgi:TldD protein
MLDRDLVRETLEAALASRAGTAEVYAEERRSTSLRLDDGKIEELTSGVDGGAGVMATAGQSTVYS